MNLKHQNTISTIKTSTIVIAAVLAFIPKDDYTPEPFDGEFRGAIRVFLILAVAMPVLLYVGKLIGKLDLSKPKWSDNPFNMAKPLIAWQYISVATLCQGAFYLLSNLMYYGVVSTNSLGIFILGLGTFTGYYITMLISDLTKKES